jgi:drug/metabolite transporter (DMT)-like permease
MTLPAWCARPAEFVNGCVDLIVEGKPIRRGPCWSGGSLERASCPTSCGVPVRRLFLLAFIWGWSFLFIKVILEDAPPTFLAWGRIALGLAVLAVALVRRREGLPERRYWGHLLVLGLTMSVLPFMLIGWGEEHISSALASVLNACTPLFAAGFAAGLLGERLRPPQLAGIAIGFLGVAVVAGVGGGDLAGSSLLGSVAVVVAGAGYGFGFAYANRFTTGLSALQLSFGQLLAGTLLLAPVAAVDVAAGRVHLGPWAALCLVLLGTLGTGYAYLLNYRTLQESGATVASLVTYLVPLVAVAAGVLVLGEPFSIRLVLGGLIVVGGVALVQGRLFGPRQESPQPVPEGAVRD